MRCMDFMIVVPFWSPSRRTQKCLFEVPSGLLTSARRCIGDLPILLIEQRCERVSFTAEVR